MNALAPHSTAVHPSRPRRTLLGLLALAPFAARAQPAEPPSPLDKFRGLVGEWTIRGDEGVYPFKMVYALASGKSAVTEYFGKELSVFSMDGKNLRMIHFCNAGNRPLLVLSPKSRGEVFEFETVSVANLSAPNADHVRKMIYRFLGERKIDLKVVWRRGAGEEIEHYVLERT